MNNKNIDENLKEIEKCSFCNVKKNDTSILISDTDEKSFICLDCVNTIHSMSHQYENNNLENIDENSLFDNISDNNDNDVFKLKPKDIKNELDKYIIGQEEAKISISIATYNHYKRLEYNSLNNNNENKIDINKSNLLFIGPSGSGKTLIVETLSNLLNVPFVIADATTFTEAGYVGDDVDSVLLKLFENANKDIKKAEKGIIFIDEIDKIARKFNHNGVSDVGVQQALLKMLEGKETKITVNKNTNFEENIFINTKDILFIAAGAFVDLDKIINKRLKNKSLGFNNKNIKIIKNNKSIKKVETNDLIEYGLIPELLGRLPIISVFEELSNKQLIDILTKPKDALIKQFITLFEMDNINLNFTEEALEEIVNISKNKKLGARGLRSVLDDILKDYMYNLDEFENKDIVISKKDILKIKENNL